MNNVSLGDLVTGAILKKSLGAVSEDKGQVSLLVYVLARLSRR